MKIDCKSDFAFRSADFCSLQEESDLGVRSFVCSTESLEYPLALSSQPGGILLHLAPALRHKEIMRLSPFSPCVQPAPPHVSAASAPNNRSPVYCGAVANIISIRLLPQISVIELQLWGLLHRAARINRAQQVSLSEHSTFFGMGPFQGTKQSLGRSAGVPKFLQCHTYISISKFIPGHSLCSALCVALSATGYTKVFLRAESRGCCRKSEPGEHFIDSKWPGLLIGPLSPLPNGAGWDEQPCLAAPRWIKVLTAFLPWAASLLTTMMVRSSLMEPLLTCSRSTLLPQPVLTTS